jgi:hypothetical protein
MITDVAGARRKEKAPSPEGLNAFRFRIQPPYAWQLTG